MEKHTMENKKVKYSNSMETKRYAKKQKQFNSQQSMRKVGKNKSILKSQLESKGLKETISQRHEKKSILETLLTQKVVEYSHGNGNLDIPPELPILKFRNETNSITEEKVVQEETIIVNGAEHSDEESDVENENNDTSDDSNWGKQSYQSLINEKNMILEEMEKLNNRVKKLESKIEIYYKLTKRKLNKIS